MPLFSIVVPIYNASLFLDKCIHSIVSQSFSDFELILVDDGSTDDSYSQCMRWAILDTRIRIFHQDNKGASAARNVGIELAQGAYIQFVDSDDTLESNCLEILAGLITKYHRPNLVEFKLNYFGPTGVHNIQGTTLKDGFYDRGYLEDTFLPVMLQIHRDDALYYNIFNVLRAIKRELIIQHGIRFHEAIRRWEDWLFALEVFHKAENMAVTTLPLYNYFGHKGGGLGGRYNPKTYQFLSMTYSALDQLFADRYPPSPYFTECRLKQYDRCAKEIFQYEARKKRPLILRDFVQDTYFHNLILASTKFQGILIVRPFLISNSPKYATWALTLYLGISAFLSNMKNKFRKFYRLVRKGVNFI